MIHRYQLNGHNIVLDVYSGSVHAVDPLAWDVIGLFENTAPDEIAQRMLEKYARDPDIDEAEIRQCIADVEALKASGKLFAPDPYENISLPPRKPHVKALCLHVAHACNLNCEYCFASQGRYQGERRLMRYEVGVRAIDFLLENAGPHRTLDVDFWRRTAAQPGRGQAPRRLRPRPRGGNGQALPLYADHKRHLD